MRALWSKELDKNGFIYGPGVPLHRVILSSLWLAASSEVCSESRELVPRLSEVTCLSLHLSRVLHAKLPKQCSLILTLQFFLSSRRFFREFFFFLCERAVFCVLRWDVYTVQLLRQSTAVFLYASLSLRAFKTQSQDAYLFFWFAFWFITFYLE